MCFFFQIWNLRTGTTSRTLLGHAGPVWCMVRRGPILVSGSQDKSAKIWDINKCILNHTLLGHNAAIFSVDMNENGSIIITGSADRVRKIIFMCVCLSVCLSISPFVPFLFLGHNAAIFSFLSVCLYFSFFSLIFFLFIQVNVCWECQLDAHCCRQLRSGSAIVVERAQRL